MARLDKVFGPENWQNEFKPGPVGGLMCGIGVRFGDQWVWKWDAAEATAVEPVKGAHSGSMKRAAVQWGIGRYLYAFPPGEARFHPQGQNHAKIGQDWFNWDPPEIPAEFLPAENQNVLTY